MLLFLLTGLWHAFNLQYLLWGGLHGAAMVAMARWQRNETGHRYRQWIASSKIVALSANGISSILTVVFVAWVSAIGSSETWDRALFVLTFGAIK
jgi:D-alanyl-lipoteichoic acid acyltransferase DltB (MBOAT superfamily)